MDTTTHDSKLIPVREAARSRGVYVRRLWTAIREGELPAYRIGSWLRVRLADVDTWIETRRVEVTAKPTRRGPGA